MRNFILGNNNFDNDRLGFNDSDSLNNSDNYESNFLTNILGSDNTEILLFIIVFLLLFTSFGRRT